LNIPPKDDPNKIGATTLSIITFGIMTLRVKSNFVTLSMNDNHHK
jgi:hypothetical protein